MANMASVGGIIFANMHDNTINDLTKLRTTGSVPFGAQYRLIDFPLSNMSNSGMSTVGVITKSNYQSLIDHLGSGSAWDLSRKAGGLRLLPPYGSAGVNSEYGGVYRGRLDALANVNLFIKHAPVEYFVLSDCDVIANIDFKALLNYHIEKNADITVVYGRESCEGTTANSFRTKTLLNINQDERVYDVLVRPEDVCKDENCSVVNVSLNVYVMSKQYLLDLVKECRPRNRYDFEMDIMQEACKNNALKVFGYKFEDYYSQINSLISYYNSNMALMNLEKRMAVFNYDRPIYTKNKDEAPAKYGLNAKVTNSLVADGCVIEGQVENCVLFRGVKIGKDSVVKNSILMQDTEIGENSELDYIITDKDVRIGNRCKRIASHSLPSFVGKGEIV